MNRMYQVILLCYICLIVFMLVDLGDANENSRCRQRRYLSFRNSTKFFLRLNFKANMVPWNQIFAQAIGFRLNWDMPPDTFHPYHHIRIYRSTVYSHLETLFDRNGMNGFHCIRRAICEMRMIAEPKGIYHRILKMIFRKSSHTEKWHDVTEDECQTSISLCPLSMLHVSLYTDL